MVMPFEGSLAKKFADLSGEIDGARDDNGSSRSEGSCAGRGERETFVNGCRSGMANAERLRQRGKIGGSGGAGIVGGAGKYDVGHAGPEDSCYLVHGFVSHDSEEQYQWALSELLGKSGAQSPGCGWIVGGVEDDCGTLKSGGKVLEASRPIRQAGAVSHALGSDAESASGKLLGGGDGQREIAKLMAACKR